MFVPMWNQIMSEIQDLYSNKTVKFINLDKDVVFDIKQKYKVFSYPRILYIAPKTQGNKYFSFTDDRTHDNVFDWMRYRLKTHGAKLVKEDTKPLNYDEFNEEVKITTFKVADEDEFMNEIVSIHDANNQENVEFEVDSTHNDS